VSTPRVGDLGTLGRDLDAVRVRARVRVRVRGRVRVRP